MFEQSAKTQACSTLTPEYYTEVAVAFTSMVAPPLIAYGL